MLNEEEQTARLRRGRFDFWFVSTEEEAPAEAATVGSVAEGAQPQYGVLARVGFSAGQELELRVAVFVQLAPLTPPLAWHQDAAQQWGDRIAAAVDSAEAMVQTLRVRGRSVGSAEARRRIRQQQDVLQQQIERLQQTGRRLASAATMIERLSRQATWQLSIEPPTSEGEATQPLRWRLSAAEGAPE